MGRTVCGRRVFNVCPDVRPLSDRRRRRREMSRSDDLDRTPARHPPRMAVGTSQRPPKPSTSVLTISPRGSARRLRASANRDPIFTSLTTVKHHTPTTLRDRARFCAVFVPPVAVRRRTNAAQTGRRFAELSTSRRWAERTRSRRMIVSLLLVTGLKRTQNAQNGKTH